MDDNIRNCENNTSNLKTLREPTPESAATSEKLLHQKMRCVDKGHLEKEGNDKRAREKRVTSLPSRVFDPRYHPSR